MSSGLGLDKDSIDRTVYDIIIGESNVEEVLQKELLENVDILPANIDLSAAEIELIGIDDKEYIIRNAIGAIKDQYDFIIIDCPPSLSMLTIQCLNDSRQTQFLFRYSVNITHWKD